MGLTPSNQPLADSLNRLRQAGRVSIPAYTSRMRFDLRSLDIAERFSPGASTPYQIVVH